MARLKIYFSYDGTRYHGYQRQVRVTHTVQEILENAFAKIASSRISVIASGRTDTGVHARIQVAHLDFPDSAYPRWAERGDHKKLKNALNSILPRDVRIWLIQKTYLHFHAIREAKQKTYLYFIDPSPVQWPSMRNYSWHLRLPLDWTSIKEATRYLTGTHDFKAFCASNSSAKTTIRTIAEARWGRSPAGVFAAHTQLRVFRITGGGFLKQMVRSIVGTLVKIGIGKEKPSLIKDLLETTDRRLVGPTAPARGLWLWDIEYKKD